MANETKVVLEDGTEVDEAVLNFIEQQVKEMGNGGTVTLSPYSYDEAISEDAIIKAFNKYADSKEKDVPFSHYLEREFFEDCFFDDYIMEEESACIDEIVAAAYGESDELGETVEKALKEFHLDEFGLKFDWDFADFVGTYEVNLMFATPKEQNYDMGSIHELTFTDDANWSESADNALSYLITQQGHTLPELLARWEGTDGGNCSRFIKTVADEMLNCSNYCSELTALVELKGQQLLDVLDAIASDKGGLTFSKNTTVGIFNEWDGGGSTLDIELEKDFTVPTSMVRNVQIEGARDNYGYTVQQVYDFVPDAYRCGDVRAVDDVPQVKINTDYTQIENMGKPSEKNNSKSER